MVMDMFNNHRGFLFADNLTDLTDKFFGIITEQSEFLGSQTIKNRGSCPPCKIDSFGNLPHEVILDRGRADFGKLLRGGFGVAKFSNFFSVLLSLDFDVAQSANLQFISVEMEN